MKNRNALVTGGAGFIGRAVVARLLAGGFHVTIIDNLGAGAIENLAPFLDAVTVQRADILDRETVEAVIRDAQPAILFHLAAHHFIPFCDAHPEETLRVNVEGTYSVLRTAAHNGVEIAVVASSGAVYPHGDLLLSEDLAVHPSDIYALSKALAEETARFIAQSTGLACVVARIFNTYGPYETNPHIIPHIIDSVRQGVPVSLGNIMPRRDYIHVADVANLLYLASQGSKDKFDKFYVVNIGTGVEYSVEELVETMSAILARKIDIRVDSARKRKVDRMSQRADITRLRALTGAGPSRSLAAGLRELLAHEGLLPTANSR